MNVVSSVLKERYIVRRLQRKDKGLWGFMNALNNVAVEVGKGAEEDMFFGGFALGEVQIVLLELKPPSVPFATLTFPFDVAHMNG